MLSFKDKVVLITGASGALGSAYARAFAKRGAKLFLNDIHAPRSPKQGYRSTVSDLSAELNSHGATAIANSTSVMDGAHIVESAIEAFGHIDVVINNAGILRDKAFHNLTDRDWQAVLDVHLTGAYTISRAVWPLFRARGAGKIIMTASAAGIYGNFGQANYSAAKLALFGLAQSLAIEGRAKGICVNTIAPLARSQLTEGIMPEALLNVLQPDAVAPFVLWLCHESCNETGGLFETGGGWISKLRWERSESAVLESDTLTPEGASTVWDQMSHFDEHLSPTTSADTVRTMIAALQSKG